MATKYLVETFHDRGGVLGWYPAGRRVGWEGTRKKVRLFLRLAGDPESTITAVRVHDDGGSSVEPDPRDVELARKALAKILARRNSAD